MLLIAKAAAQTASYMRAQSSEHGPIKSSPTPYTSNKSFSRSESCAFSHMFVKRAPNSPYSGDALTWLKLRAGEAASGQENAERKRGDATRSGC